MNEFTQLWLLDPTIYYLNHGSYGATPIAVLNYQQHLRERLEREPIQFLAKALEILLDEAREKLANFMNVKAQNLAFVNNATVGINTILRSLKFEPEDEILITDHTYNACRNAVEFVANQTGAKVTIASIPFPLESSQQIMTAILDKVSSQTKLALLDHVTSQTALIFPIETIVQELNKQGIDTLVDGAHALGFLPLDITAIGATYYTGNCHKWLCSPKGAGFLYVRPDKQSQIRPLVISHGANSTRCDRSRFLLEFDWVGTDDPTACLCIPKAIKFLDSLFPNGWQQLQQHNHNLILEARKMLCQSLNIPIPCPEEMIGLMASIPLGRLTKYKQAPPSHSGVPCTFSPIDIQTKLFENFRIEIPIIPWHNEQVLVRISAQVYNSIEQYQYLADSLKELIDAKL